MQQSPQSSLDKHVGEDTAMADAAKKAGIESHQAQSAPSKERSNDSAKGDKQLPKGKPNQVSTVVLLVYLFRCVDARGVATYIC